MAWPLALLLTLTVVGSASPVYFAARVISKNPTAVTVATSSSPLSPDNGTAAWGRQLAHPARLPATCTPQPAPGTLHPAPCPQWMAH
jgi:hypothetical protein